MSSISYINCSQAAALSTYKGDELSVSTKMRLEALGIDPSSVKTEAQAQILIAQAEAAQSQNNSGKQQGGNSSREQLVAEAKNLAQKVGARISDQDTLPDMIEKISDAIQVMTVSSSNYEKVQGYQAELKDLAARADVMVKLRENVFNKMDMVSVSNKIILGL